MGHKVSSVLCGVLDALSIGKRKHTDTVVRERDERFRSILHAAPDAIVVCDQQGRIVFWNAAAETLFGDTPDNAVGKSLASFLPKGLNDVRGVGWQPFLPTTQRTATLATVEAMGRRSDGSEFPIELSVATWRTCGKAYLVAIIRDATDRKKTAAQQEAATKLLQDAVDGVNQPIMVIGPDYRVLLTNRFVRDAYPTGSDNQPIYCYQMSHNRTAPCSGVEHPCPLRQVRDTLSPTVVVHEHTQKNGERRLFEILVAPMLADDGAFAGIVESATDITERARAEQALRESEHQYKTLYAENCDLAESLRAQLAQRGELLRSIITAQEDERKRVARDLHDELGQSLSGLTLQVRALEHDITASPNRALSQLNAICALISETTDRMYDLILALRPAALDDLGLVAALRAEADRLLTRSGVGFELDATGFDGRLAPEIETTFYRIFQEALCNVIRHADASQVRITLARHGNTFESVIADNGRGFDQIEVWQDSANPRGLGLLGIRERAACCGGKLEIFSQVGSGTRLHVEIPLVKEVGQ